MVTHYNNKGKKLYCCFIDYKKAFDSIDRNEMFYKLAKSGFTGVSGNFLVVFVNS